MPTGVGSFRSYQLTKERPRIRNAAPPIWTRSGPARQSRALDSGRSVIVVHAERLPALAELHQAVVPGRPFAGRAGGDDQPPLAPGSQRLTDGAKGSAAPTSPSRSSRACLLEASRHEVMCWRQWRAMEVRSVKTPRASSEVVTSMGRRPPTATRPRSLGSWRASRSCSGLPPELCSQDAHLLAADAGSSAAMSRPLRVPGPPQAPLPDAGAAVPPAAGERWHRRGPGGEGIKRDLLMAATPATCCGS